MAGRSSIDTCFSQRTKPPESILGGSSQDAPSDQWENLPNGDLGTRLTSHLPKWEGPPTGITSGEIGCVDLSNEFWFWKCWRCSGCGLKTLNHFSGWEWFSLEDEDGEFSFVIRENNTIADSKNTHQQGFASHSLRFYHLVVPPPSHVHRFINPNCSTDIPMAIPRLPKK